MPDLYIGLMSGTSMDAIDAVLAEFGNRRVLLRGAVQCAYPAELKRRLRAAVSDPTRCNVDEVGELDTWVAECFRDAVAELLQSAQAGADAVRAIGSHGQTLRHRPDATHRFTLQIGNPAIIATGTGIDTVADFRAADVALGGQGAPLVPPFHEWLFRDESVHRAVVNIGGVANVTLLPAGGAAASGFDTGPGNTLLDAWIRRHSGDAFDAGGNWAASGRVDVALLERLLAEPWLNEAPPKSTGVELFNLEWLSKHGIDGVSAADVQATLAELTAASIAAAILQMAPATSQLYICGGGAHNDDLLARLDARLPAATVDTTAAVGLDPDWVEAAAFAWLAKRHVEGRPGNLPAVTGAARATTLGARYPAGGDE